MKLWSLRGSLAALAVVAAFGFGAGSASASVTLFNTGINGPDAGAIDPNYSVVGGNSAVTYYNPAYIANSSGSRWVSVDGGGGAGNSTVTFTTTFTADSAALVSGFWGADNFGTIKLNGVAIASLFGTLYENFNQLHAFSFNPLVGTNVLTIELTDTGPPTAFRIDGFASAVPELSTWGMMLVGFAGVGFLTYRRRQSTAMIAA